MRIDEGDEFSDVVQEGALRLALHDLHLLCGVARHFSEIEMIRGTRQKRRTKEVLCQGKASKHTNGLYHGFGG